MTPIRKLLTPQAKRAFESSLEEGVPDMDVDDGDSLSLSLAPLDVMVDGVLCKARCMFIVGLSREEEIARFEGSSDPKNVGLTVTACAELSMEGANAVRWNRFGPAAWKGPGLPGDWEKAWSAMDLALAGAAGLMRNISEHRAASEAVGIALAALDPGAKSPAMRI